VSRYTLVSLMSVLHILWLELTVASCFVGALIVSLFWWIATFAAYILVIENIQPPHLFATISIHHDNTYPCTKLGDFVAVRVPMTIYCRYLRVFSLRFVLIT
jgi:hypothetical protein